jgi:DNA-binding MarR family transcriptional regulator
MGRGQEGPKTGREELLARLAAAGRELSDAAVMFHTAVAGQLGLAASDWKTLGLLQQHGPLTAGELSVHSGLAPASITGIVDRLEEGGWVSRRRDPADGRRVVVALDQAALMSRMGDVFGGLMRRLSELYAHYDDQQLELLLQFITEIAQRQKQATAELTREE